MGGLVLDASITLAALLPGETAAIVATAVVDRLGEEAGFVPAISWTEVGNGVIMAARRGRLPVTVDREDPGGTWEDALVLALPHRLTLYDATYLELAVRLNASLATLDRAPRNAAALEGLVLANPPA